MLVIQEEQITDDLINGENKTFIRCNFTSKQLTIIEGRIGFSECTFECEEVSIRTNKVVFPNCTFKNKVTLYNFSQLFPFKGCTAKSLRLAIPGEGFRKNNNFRLDNQSGFFAFEKLKEIEIFSPSKEQYEYNPIVGHMMPLQFSGDFDRFDLFVDLLNLKETRSPDLTIKINGLRYIGKNKTSIKHDLDPEENQDYIFFSRQHEINKAQYSIRKDFCVKNEIEPSSLAEESKIVIEKQYKPYDKTMIFIDDALNKKFSLLIRDNISCFQPFFVSQEMVTLKDIKFLNDNFKENWQGFKNFINLCLDKLKEQSFSDHHPFDFSLFRNLLLQNEADSLKITQDINEFLFYFNYRLLSIDEWNYAINGNSNKGYAFSKNKDLINTYEVIDSSGINQVATRKPNLFGLYDILGNLPEMYYDPFNGEGPKGVRGKWRAPYEIDLEPRVVGASFNDTDFFTNEKISIRRSRAVKNIPGTKNFGIRLVKNF